MLLNGAFHGSRVIIQSSSLPSTTVTFFFQDKPKYLLKLDILAKHSSYPYGYIPAFLILKYLQTWKLNKFQQLNFLSSIDRILKHQYLKSCTDLTDTYPRPLERPIEIYF